MALTRPPPVEGGDGLVPSLLVQNLPIVDVASLQLLAVQQSIHHLKVWRPPRRGAIQAEPGRLRAYVVVVGARAGFGHFPTSFILRL